MSKIFTFFMKYWHYIVELLSAVIMWVISSIRNIEIFYAIPTMIFTVGVVIWSIIGVIKLYEKATNTTKLEIIYDNGKYNNTRYVQRQGKYLYTYAIGVKNLSNTVVKACKVTVNDIGMIHAHTHEFQCDINPGATELFIINTSRFQAELASKKIEKEVEASAENVSTVTKKITL